MNEIRLHTNTPTYRSPEWTAAVEHMAQTNAPRRFSVIGHDDTTENSAILAWGFDYGDGDVIVESARDDRRWDLNSPTAANQHFPCPATGSIEIYWIDSPVT